ncbi:MAG: twin-arginine translocase TatA/TatE family subunit [Campylobacterota bacterium]|nr:twin-arginine translocase TatA/TatE family subunit [Campylobacterota bacterium]
MGMPSGFELFIIVAVVVLLFGGKKIPELAKGLGKGIKDFKGAIKEDDEVAVNDKKIEETKAETTTASAENKDTKTNA